MATTKWVAVCQDCKAPGITINTQGTLPQTQPFVPGKCKTHVSGNPNMPHRAEWKEKP